MLSVSTNCRQATVLARKFEHAAQAAFCKDSLPVGNRDILNSKRELLYAGDAKQKHLQRFDNYAFCPYEAGDKMKNKKGEKLTYLNQITGNIAKLLIPNLLQKGHCRVKLRKRERVSWNSTRLG